MNTYSDIVIFTLSLISVVSNATIIYAMLKVKSLRMVPSHRFLGSLSCADFLVGITSGSLACLSLLEKNTSYPLGEFILEWNSISSSYFTVLLMIEKYIAVNLPMKYKSLITTKRASSTAAVIYIFLLHLPVLRAALGVKTWLNIYCLVLGYVVPVVIVSCSSCQICRKIRRQRKSILSGNSPDVLKHSLTNKRERKLLLLIVLMTMFCFLCLPYHILKTLTVEDQLLQKAVTSHALKWIYCLAVAVSVLNPILYSWRLPQFRQAIMPSCFKKDKNTVQPLNLQVKSGQTQSGNVSHSMGRHCRKIAFVKQQYNEQN